MGNESKRVTEDYKSNHTRKKNNLNLQWSSSLAGLAWLLIIVVFVFVIFFLFFLP